MKVSEITIADVTEYLRLDEEDPMITPILDSAKGFIRSYTGLTDEEMDEHDEFFGVVMVLCQDMYDNRVLYVNPNNLNRMVDTTLGMHRKNLL